LTTSHEQSCARVPRRSRHTCSSYIGHSIDGTRRSCSNSSDCDEFVKPAGTKHCDVYSLRTKGRNPRAWSSFTAALRASPINPVSSVVTIASTSSARTQHLCLFPKRVSLSRHIDNERLALRPGDWGAWKRAIRSDLNNAAAHLVRVLEDAVQPKHLGCSSHGCL